MKIQFEGKEYTVMSGMCEELPANGGKNFEKAITIENNTNEVGKIVGAYVVYKRAEIADVALEIKTSNTKQNPPISGDLALAVIGSREGANKVVFKFPGTGIAVEKNIAIEVYLKTWGVALVNRDVMVGLLMEEVPEADLKQTSPKKK